ncbi:MAG: DUF2793 domain-containing protein [Hyphomicrobiaceae bacterium]|nr:DUF2793 domain-containing protein [Hyphomicrobiaceae bacterium]
MDTSPNLALPYIAAAQAQKHVTHNEAIRTLDAIVQLSVADRNVATPPANPVNGQRYIIAAAPTGLWALKANNIAAYQDDNWTYYTPSEGWLSWVSAEEIIVAWNGTAWVPAASSSSAALVNPTPLVGVNATADAANRLAVSSPATLLTHTGAGHQLKINKAASDQSGSLLFQDNFLGHAELGLTGDNDFHIKVTADGSTWRDALIIDRNTGTVELPWTSSTASTNLLINGDFSINQRAFPGGALAANTYGHDRWKADAAGTNYSVAGSTVSLASGTLVQVIELAAFGFDTLNGVPLTVSLDSPSADITVAIGTSTATISAGTSRREATLTPTTSGNITLRITKSSPGTVTFARIKLEIGRRATPWQPRPSAIEQSLCSRYFVAGAASSYILGLADTATTWMSQFFSFPTEMRTNPTLSLSNPHNIDPTWAVLVATFRGGSAIAGSLDRKGFNVYATISTGALNVNSAYIAQGYFTASAEL